MPTLMESASKAILLQEAFGTLMDTDSQSDDGICSLDLVTFSALLLRRNIERPEGNYNYKGNTERYMRQ